MIEFLFQLTAFGMVAALVAIPILLVSALAYGVNFSVEKKNTKKRQENINKEKQPLCAKELAEISSLRQETLRIQGAARKLRQENEVEFGLQEVERDRPFRIIRKEKAKEYFAVLVAESQNKLYGEGVRYEIHLAMKKLSEFGTDQINLTEDELLLVSKLLGEIKSDWKSVEIRGFAAREKAREDKEKREESRRQEAADDLAYEMERLREEADNRKYDSDRTQGEILEEQKKMNEYLKRAERGW